MSGVEGKITGKSAHPTVWLGPGERFQGLEAVLAALGGTPDSLLQLEDLDQLLSHPPASGLLLIDGDELPNEDIGLLRRFLRLHPTWQLVLAGQDPRRRTARTLLGLPGSRFLAWPPDLDQLRGLVRAPEPSVASSAEAAEPAPFAGSREAGGELSSVLRRLRFAVHSLESEPASEEARVACRLELAKLRSLAGQLRGESLPAEQEGSVFDLGEVLRGLMESASGPDDPRFLYHSQGNLSIFSFRDGVSRALADLLQVARSCAGRGDVIGVRADAEDEVNPDPDSPLSVTIDFPGGPLVRATSQEILSPAYLQEHLGELEGLAMDEASGLLGELGARLEVLPEEDGILSMRVHLAHHADGPRRPAPGGQTASPGPSGETRTGEYELSPS